jgi:hypothetical protein
MGRGPVRKWRKMRVRMCEIGENRMWCCKAWFGGFWWLDCPLATFREERSRSLVLPLGTWPCTSCVVGGSWSKGDDVALFRLQTIM